MSPIFSNPLRAVAVAAFLISGSAAAARSVAPRASAFRCANGASFSVEHVGGRVRLTTSAGRYWLRPARSSIGAKFVSGDVVLVRDGGFAALNGAAGGPFRRCHEARGPAAGEARDRPVAALAR